MSLFSRARKHIDMNRVKELREEKVRKIKHEKAAEIWKQQENYFAELKKIEQTTFFWGEFVQKML